MRSTFPHFTFSGYKLFLCLVVVFLVSTLAVKPSFAVQVAPKIAAGAFHTLALKPDGLVWSWGKNEYGQLGDGSIKNKLSPVQVKHLSSIIAIDGGAWHSLALKSDGTVWAWG